MNKQEDISNVDRFAKVRLSPIEKRTSAEVAREIGNVTVADDYGEHEVIVKNHVKEDVLLEHIESGDSINQINEQVLKKELHIEGTSEAVIKRKKILLYLAKVMGAFKKKPHVEIPRQAAADDYPVADFDRDYEEYKKVKGV